MSALKRFWSSLHPKVVAATIGSLLISALTSSLLAVQLDPTKLEGLTSTQTFVVLFLIPPLVTFLSGYSKSGPKTPVALESTSTTVALAPPVFPVV